MIQTILGNAVYRARTLMTMLNSGAHYDDLIICNSQGVYKNGSTKLQQQLTLIEQNSKKDIQQQNDIAIFPNPTLGQFQIAYSIKENETMKFILYDMFGNIIKTEILYGNVTKKDLDIRTLSSGIYTYKCIDSNNSTYFGKLIKE